MSPERQIALTPEGRQRLEAELEYLRTVRRKEIHERLHAAREATDTWDNPELQEAKNEQAFAEGRIQTLEQLLADAKHVVPEQAAGTGHDQVHFGARVNVEDEEGEKDVFTIVGSAEANPATGKISNESPVGSALLGHRVGEQVEVATPAGVRRFTIVAIE